MRGRNCRRCSRCSSRKRRFRRGFGCFLCRGSRNHRGRNRLNDRRGGRGGRSGNRSRGDLNGCRGRCRCRGGRCYRCCRCAGRWLDHHGYCGRHNGNGGTRNGSRGRRLGDHWSSWRTSCNGRMRRGNSDDGRRRTRLRDNPPRFRASRYGGRRCDSHRGWSGLCRRFGLSRRRLGGHVPAAPAGLRFLFLLFRQNSFQYVARLGDMRKINFGRNALGRTRRRSAALAARTRSALKMCANLLRFVVFQRTGMGLAAGQAELRQYVKNLSALDFHLACEIVDSNLTHPPLFKMCYPKPVSCS